MVTVAIFVQSIHIHLTRLISIVLLRFIKYVQFYYHGLNLVALLAFFSFVNHIATDFSCLVNFSIATSTKVVRLIYNSNV